jgi:ribonuclease T2
MRAVAACAAGLALACAAPALALDTPPEAGGFDYYVLALSWSPTFCSSHPADRAECGRRRGFVVHGLWPQYAAGGGPERCLVGDEPDEQTVARAKAAIPDERLIRHEWMEHGSCSGLTPREYFVTLIRATGRLAIPPQFDGESAHAMTASQIVSAFVRANPSLPPQSLALHCRGPQLEEVRVCLSRELQPQACGRGVRTRCRSGPLTVGAAR